MYLKRYLFFLAMYYLPYALLVQWSHGVVGAQPNEAHAAAHTIMALLYAGMSLNLVVFRPQDRFAFDSWMRRIMRLVVYLLLYIGLVLLPALLLLHAESGVFAVTLPVPALLFLGMLHSSGEPPQRVVKDEPEPAYPQSPLARGLYYALAYFVLFTGLAILLKGPFDEAGVPNHFRPVLFSMILLVPYLPMALMLTVVRPAAPFDFPGKGRRFSRFFIFVGLFVLFAILLPFFPANLGWDSSWFAGIVPLFLFCFMVQPLRIRTRLPVVPKTTDSRWRGLKYAAVFTILQVVIAGGLLGYWFSLEEGGRTPAFMHAAGILLAPCIGLLVLVMLHRLIVAKPHSRFQAMTKKQRYRRWWRYLFTYLMLQLVGPYLIIEFWKWNFDFNYSLALAVILFQSAAYGTDATPAWRGTRPPQPPKETPEEAIQRRLNTLTQSPPAHLR